MEPPPDPSGRGRRISQNLDREQGSQPPSQDAPGMPWVQITNPGHNQAEEGPMGGIDYQPINPGYPPGYPLEFPLPQQLFVDDGRMKQEFPQGQGLFLQQLESTYPDPSLGQFSMYQRDDQPFGQANQHGPYLRDDPALQLGPSELGFMPFLGSVPEPEPRELAVRNAKAYLLQTSVNCNLSL